MTIQPVGAELFHADGWTEIRVHDKTNSRFLQFYEHT